MAGISDRSLAESVIEVSGIRSVRCFAPNSEFLLSKFHFELTGNYDINHRKGGIRIDIILQETLFGIKETTKIFDTYIQYWNGVGESQNRAQEDQTRLSFGLIYAGSCNRYVGSNRDKKGTLVPFNNKSTNPARK